MNKSNLKEIAGLFLKLGITGFGGPAAHIAMMRSEVVVKRQWISDEHFLDLVGATNLIPGPNSTELAIHIGNERGGWKGLFVAGLCFILPAVIITGFFAWLYSRYGQLPEVQPYIYGIKPAIIAIILGAVSPLAKKSMKTIQLALVAGLVFVLSLLGINEIVLLFGAGLLALMLTSVRNKIPSVFPWPFLQITGALATPSGVGLFLTFLKIGAILYGSGYVLFAFLDTELVSTGLLSRQQLIDAIAVGQFTPGPVFSAVIFVGYQISGWQGATVATIGIFLPSFAFVAMLNPLVKKMRNSVSFSAFLDAVNVASVAIIAAICVELGRATINDWRTVLIALTGAIFTFGFRQINSAFIVLGGSLLGYLLTFV